MMMKPKYLMHILLAWFIFCIAGCAGLTSEFPDSPVQQGDTQNAALETGMAQPGWVIYAPASTTSIPIILAAKEIDQAQLTLFTSQEQANTLFMRGEISMLVGGLSVGLSLYRNGIPIQIQSTYVSGLSYLVTTGNVTNRFSDIKGTQVYVPFSGSPIEEVSQHLAECEGLQWGVDILPVYAPFETSTALLKEGEATSVLLPEPYPSLLENNPDVHISFSLSDLWNYCHPGDEGYPQIGVLVNPDWAKGHEVEIEAFNDAIFAAIELINNEPETAVEMVKDDFQVPAEVLLNAIHRTQYQLFTGSEMQDRIDTYYQAIGKPLDENDAKFFLNPEK